MMADRPSRAGDHRNPMAPDHRDTMAPDHRDTRRPSGPPPGPERPRSRWGRWVLLTVVALVALLLIWHNVGGLGSGHENLSALQSKVNAGQVASVTIDNDGGVTGKLTNGDSFTSQIPTVLNTSQLTSQLQAEHVQVQAEQSSGGWASVLGSLLPLALLLGLLLWGWRIARRSVGAMTSGLSGFGRSKAKLVETERPTTRFADVAGYDGVKQEVGEVIDFLRHPARYAAAGAKGPRGVMVGPPGTGKTLIARAVAGQARVPFLSVTGSAFVELFVGVGAARTRDLFEEARRRAPAIIFIDEIDAIGGRRGGVPGMGGHDEREQTLNQLLAELDGFDTSTGVVVLAATNRPEDLDPALLRPGRFDRRITVPLPNQADRAAILAVHTADKRLAADVDLGRVARATPGFSGADLANLVNEAAIQAVRDDRATIEATDLDTARDRVLLGRREASNALLPEERHAVAVHESGHALLAALCPNADPVAKVTILPAGVALGATEQLPEAERRLYTEAYLSDLLTVRLGGRAAELVVFGQGSTGAADDLAGVTRIAARMVREFGLSPKVGPVGYATGQPQYLGEGPEDLLRRPYSEQTQRIVDEEIARLLREAERRAVDLLGAHRDALDRLAATLEEHETVDGSVVRDILAGQPPVDAAANGYRPHLTGRGPASGRR